MKKNDENIKFDIIDKTDYKLVCSLAEKYNMSVEDFGRLLSKKVEKNLRHQIRFSPEELAIVDRRRKALDNMTRSEYCRRCYMKAIEDKSFMDLDIRKINKDTYNNGTIPRDIRVGVSFDNAEAYKIMRELAKKLSLQFSALIRHFALTVEL